MSYDDMNLQARLVTCVECGRSFYMTKPQATCIECRDNAAKKAAACR